MKPFFSVIIPTLDEKKAIPVLIHQLKEQTYQNFEIIVVDGNSTDGTLRVLKRLQADIPQLKIFATSRRNLCYQKNYGATQALGTYLVFQDADNELDPAYLQRIR
ncbi:glycosyltransferase family 2 protein, partial [Candidatus Woesebacteria bacterium]|nr:glycosyltransferase family 2 protein [Candidatus Woesebacteria bacterium]